MFVCKAHGSLNRFPLRLCVISTKPNSFSDKSLLIWMICLIITEWLGLEQSLRVIEVHGQGTRDTVQNPKAKCTNLSEDQAGPQVPCWGIHSLLSQGSAPLVRGDGRVDVPPQGVGRDPGDLLAPQMGSSQPEWQQCAARSVPATIPDGVAAAGVQRSHCT